MLKVNVLAVSAVLLTSLLSQAFIVPGDRSNPGGGISPYQPVDPNPYEPGRPGRGGDGRGGGRNDVIVKSVSLYRTVRNENLALRQLANIGTQYNGMTVESVTVLLQSPENAKLQLSVNGLVADVKRANSTYVVLTPQREDVLGREVSSLKLQVRGQARINTIEIRLRGGMQDQLPNRQSVTLNVYRSTSTQDRIDLSSLMDMRRLQGYRVESMVINARAQGRAALIDVMMDGRLVSQTMNVSDRSMDLQVRLNRSVQLSLYSRLELATRGLMNVDRVTLQLVRAGR